MGSSSNKLIPMAVVAMMFFSSRGLAQHLSGVVGLVNTGYSSTHYMRTSGETEGTDSIHLGSGFTLLGVEGYYRNGRAIISISGNLGTQEAHKRGDKFLEPFLWETHASFGWLLSENSKVCIYPAVGLGARGLSVIEHRLRDDTHIDVMKTTKPSADLSFHCDYLIVDPGTDGKIVNGIALGAKIGYNFSVISPASLHGWYFTISVGGLAFMRNDR